MGHLLKHITKLTLPVAVLLLVGLVLLWIPSFREQSAGTVLLTLCLTMCGAAILQFFFHFSGMTREMDILPAVLYMAAISVFPSLHVMWKSQLAVCCLLIVMHILYRGFREKDTTRDAFLSSLILLLSTLLIPDMIWLFPFIWIAYITLSAFSMRTMLATLIALGTFVLYLGIGLLFDKVSNPFISLFDRQFIFMSSDPEEWIIPAILMFVGCYFFIISVIHVDRDSVRQQTVLTLFALFFSATIALVVYPMTHTCSLPLMLVMLSGMATTFFRQTESVHRSIVFLIYLGLLVAGYMVPTLILDI